MKEKQCAFCDQVKPHSAFNRNSRISDGLDTYCRSCQNLRQRHNYHGTLDQLNATNRDRRWGALQTPRREWAWNRLPADDEILVSNDALLFNWTKGRQLFGGLTTNDSGYTRVETSLNGKQKKYYLHVMVYAAFHPEVSITKFGRNGYDVHHLRAPKSKRLDGTLDNSLSNLELMTSIEHRRLENRIFTDREIWMAMALYEFSKWTQKRVANLLGITQVTLSRWWIGVRMPNVSAAYHALPRLERRKLAYAAIDYWEIPRTDG